MATNLSGKCNVKKIDKDRLFVGEQGVYLDFTIIMRDEPDKYGNIGMVVQNVTEEEQKAGVKGAILGNVRYIAKKQVSEEKRQEEIDDLPF